MGSIIRPIGTIFCSLLYLNSRIGFNRLKYLYSVISVIDKRLPGNTKKWFVDGQSAISPFLGGIRVSYSHTFFLTTHTFSVSLFLSHNHMLPHTHRHTKKQLHYVPMMTPVPMSYLFCLTLSLSLSCSLSLFTHIHTHSFSLTHTLPAPMNHFKIFKGWHPRDASSKLVQRCYKTFPPDHGGQVEMKNPTRLSNQSSAA